MTRRRSSAGFTLLEVMVAVSILGLGLTAILSAQAGAFKSSSHARNMNVAIGLARCKMSEVEEHLGRDGFQLTDEIDSGPCCEGDVSTPVHCSWKIEQPQLPEPKYGDLNLSSSPGDLGALGILGGGTSAPALGGGGEVKLDDVAKVLAGANQGIPTTPSGDAWNPGADAGKAGLIQGSDDIALGGASGSAAGAIASVVMSMVYPDLKTLFEASTRRVTVSAIWHEGVKDYSIDIVQWVTSPQQDTSTPDDVDGGAPASSASGGGPSTGSGGPSTGSGGRGGPPGGPPGGSLPPGGRGRPPPGGGP